MKKVTLIVAALWLLFIVLTVVTCHSQVLSVQPYTGSISLYHDTALKVLRINYDPIFGGMQAQIYAETYGPNPTSGALEFWGRSPLYIEAQQLPTGWLDWKLPGQLRIPLQEVIGPGGNMAGYVQFINADTLVRSINFTALPARWDAQIQFYDPGTFIVYRSPLFTVDIPSSPPVRSRKKPHPVHPR